MSLKNKKIIKNPATIIAIFIYIFSFPSYAFFSDTKIIECSALGYDRKVFKFEKKLLSEPTLTQRKNGLWKTYCSQGKLVFNEDSIMCKGKIYNSTLDLVTHRYRYTKRSKPITKNEFAPLLIHQFVCLIDGK